MASARDHELYNAHMHQDRSPGGTRQFALELEFNEKEKDVYLPEDEAALIVPKLADDDDSLEDSLEDHQEEKFHGEFRWEGFEQTDAANQRNNHLLLQLDEKEKEIHKLEVMLQALEPIPGLDPEKFMDVWVGSEQVDQDYRDCKIIDQAKKLKHYKIELSKQKRKNGELLKSLERAAVQMDQMEAQASKISTPREASPKKQAESGGESAVQMREMSKRLEELRLKLNKKDTDLKKTLRALKLEVGEGVDVSKTLQDGGDWRGRAQQIIMLKTKIKRLTSESRNSPGMTGAMSGAGSTFQSSRLHNDVDFKAAEDLRAIEQEKARHVEQLTEEYGHLQQHLGEVKRKLEASRARTKVLESESVKNRQQMKIVLDKGANDDELIEALKRELANTRGKFRKLQQKRESETLRNESKNNQTNVQEVERLQSHVREQQRRIEQLDSILHDCRRQIQEKDTTIDKLKKQCHYASVRPNSAEIRQKATTHLESESSKARVSFLEIENQRMAQLVEVLQLKLSENALNAQREADPQPSSRERGSTRQRPVNLQHRHTTGSKQQLLDQIEKCSAENEALRASFRNLLANKDEEIKSLKGMVQEQRKQLENAINRMQVDIMHGKVKNQQSNGLEGQNDFIEELARENESLRSKIQQVREENVALLHAMQGNGGGKTTHGSLSARGGSEGSRRSRNSQRNS